MLAYRRIKEKNWEKSKGMNNEVKIERCDIEGFERILPIYEEAFPDDERKPYSMLLENHESGRGEMLAVKYGDNIVGMVFMCFYMDYALIDYFAIDKELRGLKIGERAMGLLHEKYSDKKLFLEIEDPDINEMATRRLHFYERCGLKRMNVYVDLFGVPMELLAYGDFNISFEDYFGLYAYMTNESFARKNVKRRSI